MKKSDHFSKEEILRLANSPAGQQLMALLQADHADAYTAAQRNAGDLEQVKAALSGFLSDPKAQLLMKQLQEDFHG